VYATPAGTKEAVRRFLHPSVVSAATPVASRHAHKAARATGLVSAPRSPHGALTPTRRLAGAVVDSTRRYMLSDDQGVAHRAYRLSMRAGLGEYYGVQGTDWTDPPILASPDEQRRLGHRTFELYYDGHHLRRVALQTDKGAWWVTNTLTLSLTNAQMLAIARSLRQSGHS
jgi:polyisoprenyl-teichoic acid--peptidoglycan teichoic acid transferase